LVEESECFNLDHAAGAAVEKELSCKAGSSFNLAVVSLKRKKKRRGKEGGRAWE